MMAQPPAPDYRFWSPDSTRTIRLEEMLQELRREAKTRPELYPRLIEAKRLTEMDAAAEIAMMHAIVDEFAWALGRHRGDYGPPPLNSYTWFQKVACLRREIEIRRATYPKAIARLRLTHEDAQRHLSAIEAAHAWYWSEGLDLMDGRWATRQLQDNIRAELERRERWAIEHGYDITGPAYCAGIYDGDWSAVPRLAQEAAE